MYKNITGIILCGGTSSRMGQNKSLLKLGDSTIIQRVVNLMSSLFESIIIVTNTPEEYNFLHIPLYEDIYKKAGPIGGIHAGLHYSTTAKNFVISCDIPLMNEGTISHIIDYPTEKQITVAVADGFIQQLAGLYNKKIIPDIERIISKESIDEERNPVQQKRKCKVLQLIESVNGEIIDIEKTYSQYIPGTFYNMNRPEEYEFIKSKIV
ncbi:MAG: molybdenum cofactor guanylyltransferase [Bacteroidota bacterium]|nr:molybdenum cofactor guanylyltransferase [Bacteroidota bacterium]